MAGSVRELRNAREADRNARVAGTITAKRALEIGLATLRETGVTYDERWTTTVALLRDRYLVTFPLPENARSAPLRSDYALLVAVDSRSGRVLQVLAAA